MRRGAYDLQRRICPLARTQAIDVLRRDVVMREKEEALAFTRKRKSTDDATAVCLAVG
jgi:hypothetical protein